MHENSLRTQVFGWDNESRGHLGAAEAVDQTFLKYDPPLGITSSEGSLQSAYRVPWLRAANLCPFLTCD
jgi:hypothetical protein